MIILGIDVGIYIYINIAYFSRIISYSSYSYILSPV